MAWDLTGVRRGTSDDQGCNGLKVQTYGGPGRHGPRARNVPLGGNGTLIPVMLMIGITASFRSLLRSFLGWRPTERVYDFHTMESAITYDAIICPIQIRHSNNLNV